MTTYYNAEFTASHIVKRSAEGAWCVWDTDHYDPLVTAVNGIVSCIAESPDGTVYIGGGFTNAGGDEYADYLARWNGSAWESVIASISSTVYCMAFDANGDLYIGGNFTNLGDTDGNYIVKLTDLNGTPAATSLGTGMNGIVYSIVISPDGDLYAGGEFTLAGGVANTVRVAKWDGSVWTPLSTGINFPVLGLAIAPNDDLYIGGTFYDALGPPESADYLCKWDGTEFSMVGSTQLNQVVETVTFDSAGRLIIGGIFTNAGGVAEADYIARWNGNQWEDLAGGLGAAVYEISPSSDGSLYVAGGFTTAGDLDLTDRIAIYNNGAWMPLDIDLPGTDYIYAVLPASDGSLWVGGDFTGTAVSGIMTPVEISEYDTLDDDEWVDADETPYTEV